MNNYLHKRGNPSISIAIRLGVGFLIPVSGLIAFVFLHNINRPHVGGPEGGFAQYGYGIVSLIIVGAVFLFDLIMALSPFRTIPALLSATLIPAVIAAMIIASIP
jgi:hypothetical protein